MSCRVYDTNAKSMTSTYFYPTGIKQQDYMKFIPIWAIKPSKSQIIQNNTPENNVQFAPTVIKHCKEHIPLKFVYFNAQWLYNKFLHLTDLVAEEDRDVIAITETWLDSSISDTEFTPGGYTTFRKDLDITNYPSGTYVQNNRGGVLLLIKNYLSPTIYTDADVEAEIIWV